MQTSQFNRTTGTTDVVFQSIKLYIEGIQVPFTGISITQGIGQLPSATIQLPPQSGLMDIARYYQPKVHIFFEDPVTADDRLLFSGLIIAVAYSKSAAGSGSSFIQFECAHKNSLLQGLTLDFSGMIANQQVTGNTTTGAESVLQRNPFNSLESIELAMKGMTDPDSSKEVNAANVKAAAGDYTKVDPRVLPKQFAKYKERLRGFAGVIVNYWNQMKEETYNNPDYFQSMDLMYIPLIEQGLQFIQRLAGHNSIESLLDQQKAPPCPDDDAGDKQPGDRLIPPAFMLNTKAAIQADMAIEAVRNMGHFSGELTNLYDLFANFFNSIDYQLLTLASPAMSPVDPTEEGGSTAAVDTIVKPELPFYYTPACNVYMPNMFWSISIQQDEVNIPTRITVTHDFPTQRKIGTNYRAPASIRAAIAAGNAKMAGQASGDLLMTTNNANNNIGKYEQGRGIHHHRLIMPNWLSLLNYSKASDNPNDAQYTAEEQQTVDLLQHAWDYRYGADKSKLNPWSKDSGIPAYQRILFAAADYKFTQEVVKSKAGTLEGIFNPYIVPGYPMDILDRSPTEPSFHAYCTSVTHNITPSSISTTVNFVAAITYEELSNYYLQYVHPWLQTTLKLVYETDNGYSTSLLNNPEGLEVADTFYGEVLGVQSIAPDDLYDFASGSVGAFPGTDPEAKFNWKTGREENPNHSAIGNLSLIRREIETKDQIAATFGLTFIDMLEENYNSSAVTYQNSIFTEPDLLEPGASLFLDYSEVGSGSASTIPANGMPAANASNTIMNAINAPVKGLSDDLNIVTNKNPLSKNPFGGPIIGN